MEQHKQGVISYSDKCSEHKIYYHLPGLFEFYELYSMFLPLFFEHRDYFYDWCEIGSIYGAPSDCLWGGGRVGFGDADTEEVIELMNKYGISSRLTFSNSLLKEEHLNDRRCNTLCRLFEKETIVQSGVIVYSDLLLNYIRDKYPYLYMVSSTTKVLTEFEDLKREIKRDDFLFVVPDFRLNKKFNQLEGLTESEKNKIEFLCNECCYQGCLERKKCYENVSAKALGITTDDFKCKAPSAARGYRFSEAMSNPSFIGTNDIREVYFPMGFNHYKIEGRGLGSAVILEFLLYYLAKPEYHLRIREEIYLDSMLDLF